MEPADVGPSIVGYGSYHYKYDSGREGDMCATGFSPRKANLVLYIMPGYQDYGALLDRLGKHKLGKSCLYLNKLADVDEGCCVRSSEPGWTIWRRNTRSSRADYSHQRSIEAMSSSDHPK